MRTPRHDPADIRRLLEQRDAEGLTYRQLPERSGVSVHVLTYRASHDRLAARDEAGGSSLDSSWLGSVSTSCQGTASVYSYTLHEQWTLTVSLE